VFLAKNKLKELHSVL